MSSDEEASSRKRPIEEIQDSNSNDDYWVGPKHTESSNNNDNSNDKNNPRELSSEENTNDSANDFGIDPNLREDKPELPIKKRKNIRHVLISVT